MKNPSKTGAFKPTNGNRPGARPGVRLRGVMAEMYQLRGHTAGKLWIQYSCKNKADQAFANESDYIHFLYLESSPDVIEVDYSPAEAVMRVIGERHRDEVKAIVKFTNGRFHWQHVCADSRVAEGRAITSQLETLLEASGAALATSVPQVQLLTHKELVAQGTLIRNWHRVASWLAAARDWDLQPYTMEVAALIRNRGRVEFEEVLALGSNTDRSCLYGAALLEQVQRGAYLADLADVTFSLRSFFWQPRRPA